MPDSGDNAFVLATNTTRGVYVVMEKNGKWGLPGGGIKKRESPLDGAVREFQEETGVELEKDKLTKVWEKKGKSGVTTTLYTTVLNPKLDYRSIFGTRTTPKETKAFSYAVYPEGAKYPYVLSQDGTTQAKSFKNRESWRGGVGNFFAYFPRISADKLKIRQWREGLFLNNPKLKDAGDQKYITFVLRQCAKSNPVETNLQKTPAYKESLKVRDWKIHGVYREQNLDEYTEYVDDMRELADRFFSGYPNEIHGYRQDSNHLGPRDRLAWPVSLCTDGFGISPSKYTISAGVGVFPIFLLDRKGEAFNECEVVALSAHNRRKKNGDYELTPIAMDHSFTAPTTYNWPLALGMLALAGAGAHLSA